MIVKKYSTPSEREKLYDRLLHFMAEIYVSTAGKYPAMEWLPPWEKPDPNAPNFFEEFSKKYGSFLKWRLTQELDEVYLAFIDDELVGVVGLNYDLEGKTIPWIPEELTKRKDVGFIELFAVHPKHRGKGIGTTLFKMAINRLKELGKKPFVVTFPDLNAVKFYEKMGGKIIMKFDKFLIYIF